MMCTEISTIITCASRRSLPEVTETNAKIARGVVTYGGAITMEVSLLRGSNGDMFGERVVVIPEAEYERIKELAEPYEEVGECDDRLARLVANFEYARRKSGKLDDETREFLEDLTREIEAYG